MKAITSYVKGTNDILNKMNATSKLPKGAYLVTMDERSLYTNISISQVIAMTKRKLENRFTQISQTHKS